MPGGLLNIVAYGNQNIILNGNPSKTFFKAVYVKYTNFGIQKFRLDFQGTRDLDEETDTTFTFKIPRYAELLLDTYLVFTLPDIYSPILPPRSKSDMWKPYHFKWVHNIGTAIIRDIKFKIGMNVIQEFPGEYIHCLVERDFGESKKKLFNEMTANTIDIHSPEIYSDNRFNNYPNAFYNNSETGSEPSIRGRKVYVPLHPWYMNDSKMALPLVSLEYSEMEIEITLRPTKELFTINSINSLNILSTEQLNQIAASSGTEGGNYDYTIDYDNNREKLYTRRRPDFTNEEEQLYNFLQQPPTIELNRGDYENKVNKWNADIHLIANYCFLTSEESNVFANYEQNILVKDVKYQVFYNIAGNQRVKIDTNALVSSWMWYFRRNDVYERNEWNNFTNWKTSTIPFELVEGEPVTPYTAIQENTSIGQIGPGEDYNVVNNANRIATNHHITPNFSIENTKDILTRFAIIFDGKFREDEMDAGVYFYTEKYRASQGCSKSGIYSYNFCINTSPTMYQPSGAINLSRFKSVEFEMQTIVPPSDPQAQVITLCDDDGNIIGTTKPNTIYKYTYEMHLFEERYNVLRFVSGNAGLLFAR
jgi:hypothetical protein